MTPTPHASLPGSAARPSQLLTILVIDDNADMRAYLRSCLGGVGRVLEAADGVEALGVLANESVEFVVIDFIMPRMDGLSLCRALRANARYATVPILFISGAADTAAELPAGCGFLAKPFNARAIRSRIAELLAGDG